MYQNHVIRYFESCERINQIKEFGLDWDTTPTELEIFDKEYDIKSSLDIKETSDRFHLSSEQVTSFFIVHCCLSNYLYNLTGKNRTYMLWQANSSTKEIDVYFDEDTVESYTVHDISNLMSEIATKNGVTWTYNDLA
ncbi:hypothetical protein [Photobacterium damselae]|uniref:hypothetical protein n=1 Tax=Photobacterium damselae TaxID=38293 RepID=UPI001F37EC40|nr:hypothetical protein [Photobacterium damselae]UKA04797.1 hypothetical protein IHC89_21380 [Photobacterium damselae subsp. damselae]